MAEHNISRAELERLVREVPGTRSVFGAPMIGGLASSFLPELLVYPAVCKLWKLSTEMRRLPA